MKPLEASLFKPLPPELKDNLIRSNVVPVNDALIPLWNNTHKILLLYGGWGSGKSVFFVDSLIDHAITDKYFRCYFGRKILDTVRGSVFKTITDRIKELKKVHLFNFSDAPNGSMVITCKENNNEFFPFGANDSSSFLSIKDPTHFFCEELDQFTFDDFGDIYSRLRKDGVILQFYGAFNTEKIYQSHWLRKVFFDGQFADQSFKFKVNYIDNYFIDREAYYKNLQLTSNGDAIKLAARANGEWGVVRTGGEFWKQFDETKHVGKVDYVPGVIWLSLDENVTPYVTCTCWQVRGGKDIKQIKEILCKPKDKSNNAPKAAAKVADWLDSIKHTDVVFVCGDPSASARSSIDPNNASFFDKFIEVLRERGYKVTNKVMRSAPEVALAAAFINALYENKIYGWSIEIGDMCFESIEEYVMIKEDAEGKPFVEKEKDPDTGIPFEKNGHITATKRYLVVTVMDKEWQDYKKGAKNKTLINQLAYFR